MDVNEALRGKIAPCDVITVINILYAAMIVTIMKNYRILNDQKDTLYK